VLICAPVGFIFGAAFIYSFSAQRQVAMHVLQALRELKKRR
jgi:hypothetical protein